MDPNSKYKVIYPGSNGQVNESLRFSGDSNSKGKVAGVLVSLAIVSVVGVGAYFAKPKIQSALSDRDLDKSLAESVDSFSAPVASAPVVTSPTPSAQQPTPVAPPVQSTVQSPKPAAKKAAAPAVTPPTPTSQPVAPALDSLAISEVETLAVKAKDATVGISKLQAGYNDSAASYQNIGAALGLLGPVKAYIDQQQSTNPKADLIFSIYGEFVDGMIKGLTDTKALGAGPSYTAYSDAMKPYYAAIDYYNANSTVLSSNYNLLKAGK